MTGNMDAVISVSTTGALVLEGQDPQDVARAIIESRGQKEPFHIFDMDEAYRRMHHFKNMIPRAKMFYAMKANSTDMILKLAVSQGLGFDCASPGEIHKVKQLGVDPLSIIYAVPYKTPEQMMFARDAGVKHTTFDTLYELKKTKQYWPDARLLLRLRVDSDSLYKLGEKFGCDFETEAFNLLDEAASLGLKVVGVAFHVGSACFSIESYVVGLRRVKALFDHEAQAGREMKIVDIGGGFLSDRTERINEVSELINSTLDELFDPNVQIIAEPGRYVCDSAYTLYSNISNIRKVVKNNKLLNMIYINDGIYGTLRCSEPWHTVHRFKWSNEKEIDGGLEETIIYGPSCDCDDQVMRDRKIYLPKCTPFDWLIFGTQGAYTFGFSSYFSCLEIPLIRTVVSQELWNKIKNSPVFGSSEFLLHPDISSPLPSTLPPQLSKKDIDNISHSPSLKL